MPIEGKTPDSSQPPSRRELLFPWKKAHSSDGTSQTENTRVNGQPSSVEKNPPRNSKIDQLNFLLKKKMITRRVAVGLILTGTGTVAVDQLFLKGKITKAVWRFLTDEDYRNKLFLTIQQGRLGDKLQDQLNDLENKKSDFLELGEKKDYRETWLDDCFSEYEIRDTTVKDGEASRLLFIGKVDKAKPIQAQYDQYPGGKSINFTLTEAQQGPFATVPGPQTEDMAIDTDTFSYSVETSRLWSQYQINGQKIEIMDALDGKRNPRGGALIVDLDNNLIVVDRETSLKYSVFGEPGLIPCLAKETLANSISSETATDDLAGLGKVGFMDVDESQRQEFGGLIATFIDKDNKPHSYILAMYQFFDANNKKREGKPWTHDKQLSMSQGVDICQQLIAEKGFLSFVLAVPDSREQSRINGPQSFSTAEVAALVDEGLLRTDPNWTDSFTYYNPDGGRKLHRTIGSVEPINAVNRPVYFIGVGRATTSFLSKP